MAKFESINLLFKILKEARYPVSKDYLKQKLECSTATVERYLSELRDTYSQKVIYSREYNGYQLENNTDDIELPSHLFTSEEINAILLVDQLINNLEPGFFKQDMQSVKQHLSKIKGHLSTKNTPDANRIRMINIGKRINKNNYLSVVTKAVLQRKIINIKYDSRSLQSESALTRVLSPQRLTHYRDNWYLDAWCHEKEALRTFSLERIESLELNNTNESMGIVNLSDKQLDDHYAQTFGIFGGKTKHLAVLKFTAQRAQWVSEEIWHQHQSGKWLSDGSYLLEIPYGNDLELIGDILKYGDQVEVLEPLELKNKLKTQAELLFALYH